VVITVICVICRSFQHTCHQLKCNVILVFSSKCTRDAEFLFICIFKKTKYLSVGLECKLVVTILHLLKKIKVSFHTLSRVNQIAYDTSPV